MDYYNDVVVVSSTGADSIESSAENVLGATTTPTDSAVENQMDVGTNTTTGTTESGNSSAASPFPAVLKNDLRNFTSYNYIFTLSCLTFSEINSPDVTYRVQDPVNVILRTGGGVQGPVRTAYEGVGGRIEYFIDNVEIDTLIVPNKVVKQTNATNIRFQITEPYSMGIFLQTLQVAALNCGRLNYMDAIYLLTVDFKGWNDLGEAVVLPKTRRMFPIKLSNIDFDVTESGSMYNVEAIPFNEEAFSEQVQIMKADLQLQGKNLHELCQIGGHSITSQFNDREEKRRQKDGTITPNQYVILFPQDRRSGLEELAEEISTASSATINPSAPEYRQFSQDQKKKIYDTISGGSTDQMPSDFDPGLSLLLGIVVKKSQIGESILKFAEDPANVNEIGKAKIVESYLDGNKQPFGKAKFVENKDTPGVFERGKIQIQIDKMALTFKSRSTIQEMIEELVLLSEYGKSIVQNQPDKNGLVKWFKIESNVFLLNSPEEEKKSGKAPRIFVYRVVPYKTHVSRFASPTQATAGLDNLKKQICKKYSYIYSGSNDDVLDFAIEFNSAFYTSITPFAARHKAGSKDANSNRMAGDFNPPEISHDPGNAETTSTSGSVTERDDVGPETGRKGGGQYDTDATAIARDFNDALTNSEVDLVGGTLTIWGDPYYIADSGMGNYTSAESTSSINLTADNTMDYQFSEVHILLEFRTPLDYGINGWAEFNDLGRQGTSSFSGIYQVTSCLNKFQDGVFSQELSLIRVRNQPGYDTLAEPVSTGVLSRGTIALPGGGTAAAGVENFEEFLP